MFCIASIIIYVLVLFVIAVVFGQGLSQDLQLGCLSL